MIWARKHSRAGDDERSPRIDDIVRSVIRQADAGVSIDDAEIEQRYPELMPELRESLRTARAIRAAAEKARQESAPSGLNDDHDAQFEDDFKILGELLTDYELLERLDHGGQGAVYKAVQKSANRIVAIKVLLDGPLASTRQRHRFEREVHIISRLRHPNVVTLYDSGVVRGRQFFAMEYIDGFSINDYILFHRPSVESVVRLFTKVCRAVGSAHQRGILHRDLKPANILIDLDDEPHILDFGLAKDIEEAEETGDGISLDGQVVGTLPYLSPEQASGLHDEIDVRSDIYALGVVLYQLLSGAFPYPVRGDAATVRDNILNRAPLALSKAVRTLEYDLPSTTGTFSDDLERVVFKALAKDKARRYQSADALADDLDRYLAGDAVQAKADSSLYLLRKTIRRYRVYVAFAAVIVLLMGASAGMIANLWIKSEGITASSNLKAKQSRIVQNAWLNELLPEFMEANRRRELSGLPPELHAAHLKRYQDSRLAPMQTFRKLVEHMPDNLLRSVSDPTDDAFGEGERWLLQNSEYLDQIAASLRASWFRFPVDEHTSLKQGWHDGDLSTAARVCEAFVAGAYYHKSGGRHHQAISDLTVARSLAMDIGDGVTFLHKTESVNCRKMIYSFLQTAMGEALCGDGPVDAYARRLIADPVLVSYRLALSQEKLIVLELVTEALAVDAAGRDQRLDEHKLAERLELTGRLTPGQRAFLLSHRPQYIAESMAACIERMSPWEDLSYAELTREIANRSATVAEASQTNPLLLLVPNLGRAYLKRLQACSQRRALRLAAFAAIYHADNGRWPNELADCLPADHQDQIIDRASGEEFVYDLVGGLPRIRSISISSAARANESARPATSDGAVLVTYFPGPNLHRE